MGIELVQWALIVVAVIGYLWIVVSALTEGHVLWAIGIFFIPVLAFVYAIYQPRYARVPAILLLVGGLGSLFLST